MPPNSINKKRRDFGKKRKDKRTNIRRMKEASVIRSVVTHNENHVNEMSDIDVSSKNVAATNVLRIERNRLKSRKPRGLSGKKLKQLEKAARRSLPSPATPTNPIPINSNPKTAMSI
mmetsp:Transcript_5768/g.10184  ORF Transcript_5768/g.10184 Transcript_5768/m.10184 type:complete len:117 (-) Transcript_5768:1509-1859(-)